MTLFLQSLLLCAAAFSAGASDPGVCSAAVKQLLARHRAKFAKLALATGKSLPYDAGKYAMCVDNADVRYFLVKMDAKLPGMPKGFPMELGLCVPDNCTHDGIVNLTKSLAVNLLVPGLSLMQVDNITSSSPQLDLKYENWGGVLAAVVFGFFVLLVVASSSIVLMKQGQSMELPQHRQPTAQQQQLLQTAPQQTAKHPLIVEAFSLFGKSGTVKKLMEIPPYKPTDSLNGLRVLSMGWIILGHSFLMPKGISGYSNEQDMFANPLNKDTAENNPLFALVTSSQTGVDTFFFLSGFLLSHLTLKEMASGKLKILPAIILRYLRLTPSLALIMLVYYKIWVFLGYGPFSVRFQDGINSRCDGSWWSELTYTMNFVPFDSDKVCLGWSWYLGDDMIFFIISLIIMPIYHKRKWLGWLSILTLTGISFGLTGWLVVRYNLSIYPFDKHWSEYAYYAYSKPYTRVPAYFVGIIAAWLLDEVEKRGITRETRSNSFRVRTGATLASCLAWGGLLFIIFIVVTDFGDHKDSWGNAASVLYIVFSRPLWAMCWAVITLLCYYDLAPCVNAFLAHRFWTPLARLTYGAYLVHPLVIKLASGRALQYFTFNSWDLTYRTVGNFIMAYTGSFVFWCLIERPCMTIFSPAKKPSRAGAKNTPTKESSHSSSGDASALPSTACSSDGNSKVDGFSAEALKSGA